MSREEEVTCLRPLRWRGRWQREGMEGDRDRGRVTETEIYCKKLAHVTVEAGKVKMCTVGQQDRDPRKG